MAGLEIVEGRERDASRQRRCNERAAAALAAVDIQLETEEQGEMRKRMRLYRTASSVAKLNLSRREKSESDNGLRRSGRVKRATRAVQPQLSQIEQGLIPAPGAKGKFGALNVKKRQNTKVSRLEDEFELIE
jgi:hypothetical protein